MTLILKIQIDTTSVNTLYIGKNYKKAIPVSFKCFHNSGVSNSFDLKTIARAAATVDRKIVRLPKLRKETKTKHQRAS